MQPGPIPAPPQRLLRAFAARIAAVERRVLLAILLVAGTLWGAAEIAAAVVAGSTNAFDESILLALRSPGDPSDPLGPLWFEEMMRDFTALGGTGVLAAVTLAVAGFLAVTGQRQAAALVILAVATGTMVSHGLKWGFDRPRPDLVPHGMTVYSQSFPSGHAMLSAVTYLTLGALLARVQPRRAAKAYPLAVAALIVGVVGASRVYLGVHWPTDVLAGWAFGSLWAALCWFAMLWLQRRRGGAAR